MYIWKQCWLSKDSSLYYKHPLTKNGLMWRCKECVNDWRKSEHERKLSRIRDKNRYENNDRRRLYSIRRWLNARCYDKSNSHYRWYWLKWITVWWESFSDFYDDVIDIYRMHYLEYWKDRKYCQLDRINNNWNYEKNNVRFVTSKENNNNRYY